MAYPAHVPDRPTRTVKRFNQLARKKQTGYWGSGAGMAYPTYSWHTGGTEQKADVSPYEWLDTLTEQFNKQPLRFKTDPATGKTVASRTMAKMPAPKGMGKFPRFKRFFGEGELSSSWVLPAGAMSGERFISRTTPQSDIQRQGAYRFGVKNAGTPRLAVNPKRFWPGSSFKVPMREAEQVRGGAKTMPEPVFGSTVDYTTGRYYGPSDPYGYSDPYGQFDPSAKRPPMFQSWRAKPTYRPNRPKSGWGQGGYGGNGTQPYQGVTKKIKRFSWPDF